MLQPQIVQFLSQTSVQVVALKLSRTDLLHRSHGFQVTLNHLVCIWVTRQIADSYRLIDLIPQTPARRNFISVFFFSFYGFNCQSFSSSCTKQFGLLRKHFPQSAGTLITTYWCFLYLAEQEFSLNTNWNTHSVGFRDKDPLHHTVTMWVEGWVDHQTDRDLLISSSHFMAWIVHRRRSILSTTPPAVPRTLGCWLIFWSLRPPRVLLRPRY